MQCQAITIIMKFIDFSLEEKRKELQVKLLSENHRAYDNACHNLVY